MPKTSDGIRENIITAARAFFGKYGLSKTTIDDIAKQANMAKSSLYYYFKSKEEMFIAVVEQEAGIFKAEVADAMTSVNPPHEKLRAYFITRMRLFKELSTFYNVFKDEYIANYGFIQKIRKTYDAYEVDMIKGILSRGVASKVFDIQDIDLTSVTLQGILKSLEYDWAISMPEKEIEKTIDRMMGILLHGIMKH